MVFKCNQHNKQIQFVCVGNEWHFQPLCNDCVSQHCQSHSKKIKVMLQTIPNVLKKVGEQCVRMKQALEEQYTFLTKQQSINSVWQDRIVQIKGLVVGTIQKYFSELVHEINKSRKIVMEEYEKQKGRITGCIQEKIKRLDEMDKTENIEQWVSVGRSIYYKNDISDYIEEMTETINAMEDNIRKNEPILWQNQDTIGRIIRKSLESMWKSTKKDMKNIQKVVQNKRNKPRMCEKCNGEMKYLTEWKKHMVCMKCNYKVRNYQRKG